MTIQELNEKMQAECTGDAAADLAYLAKLARDIRKEPNAEELTVRYLQAVKIG